MERVRRKIMLVDDNITNLTIGKSILSGRYDVFTVPSGEKLLKILERATPDLILLDVEMPEMDGFEALKALKANEATSGIPVVFLTARCDVDSEAEGLSLGAVDYITKPFSPPLLLRRIELHMQVIAQCAELEELRSRLGA